MTGTAPEPTFTLNLASLFAVPRRNDSWSRVRGIVALGAGNRAAGYGKEGVASDLYPAFWRSFFDFSRAQKSTKFMLWASKTTETSESDCGNERRRVPHFSHSSTGSLILERSAIISSNWVKCDWMSPFSCSWRPHAVATWGLTATVYFVADTYCSNNQIILCLLHQTLEKRWPE